MKVTIDIPEELQSIDLCNMLENIKLDLETAICEFCTYTGSYEIELFSKLIEAFKESNDL